MDKAKAMSYVTGKEYTPTKVELGFSTGPDSCESFSLKLNGKELKGVVKLENTMDMYCPTKFMIYKYADTTDFDFEEEFKDPHIQIIVCYPKDLTPDNCSLQAIKDIYEHMKWLLSLSDSIPGEKQLALLRHIKKLLNERLSDKPEEV